MSTDPPASDDGAGADADDDADVDAHVAADDGAPAGERADPDVLHALLADLLVQDDDRHERALAELADVGDERVVAHLVDAATMHAVASDWENLGFPEVFRGRDPPYAFQHPECRFPGVLDALCAVAEPDFDDPGVAWLQWESWYTQTDPETLEGYVDWTVRFYRTYHPTVGHLLDAEPRHPDFEKVRWGSTDPTVLHPLNFPDWTTDADHLEPSDLVYGFRVDGDAYAVPRYLLFPHEFANLEIAGEPLALSYCTMCNSPVLYDRRVGKAATGPRSQGSRDRRVGKAATGPRSQGSRDRRVGKAATGPRQFASTGCLWNGNKLMYDEETLSLWNQQTGTPVAGPEYARDRDEDAPDVSLSFLPVTQTTWGEWTADHPDSRTLSRDTGYDLDYEFYRDYDGFVKRHYWENEDVFHPGVRAEASALDDRTYVYGVDADDGLHAFVVDAVRDDWPVRDVVDGRDVVALPLDGDVAVYEAPPGPLERAGGGGDDDGGDHADRAGVVVDANRRAWSPTHDGLVPDGDAESLPRLPGRHGLWLAFRPHYADVHVVGRPPVADATEEPR